MKIRENVLLRDYTTYRIGGPARYFCEVKDESGLQKAVSFAKDKQLQIFILGGGSNLIISDNGFNGLVIKILNTDFERSEKQGSERS
ncbi:MAG: FAD-binding protein [Candidatus Portnoybacteria bacterium]|nr:FAD-binding protein [Candidatus Portnoybacteria bacterium]